MNKKKDEKKLTKAQLRKLEKERKAEEERKQLEEEARKQAEDQRIKEELESKRKAERDTYKAAEKERLAGEEKNYYSVQMEVRKKKDSLLKEFDEQENWKKYLDCSNEYDVTNEADLNLMLVLIEELSLTNDKELKYLLEKLDTSEEIITKLEKLMLMLKTRGRPVKTYRSFIEAFGALINKKFEYICNYISQNSEYIVLDKLEEIKSNDKLKTTKATDNKPEVQLFYPKKYSQLAFYIMGFENSGIKTKPIDFSDFNVLSDMPKAFFSKKLIMIAKKFFKEYFALGSLEHDNPHLRLIDGVVDVECIAYLPETKQIKNYQVKRIYNPTERLDRLTYNTVEGSSSSYRVYIALSKDIIVVPRDNLEVRYWNNGKWISDGIGEVSKEYNKELDKAFFVIPLPKMAPVAVLINRFTDLPYKSFKIRRVGINKVLFTLLTQRVELKFEINPYNVRLVSSSQPKLDKLINKEYKPTDLLYELQSLNVLLINDHLIVPKPKEVLTKDVDLARVILKEVSKASLFYHIQSSKWNPYSRSRDYILRIRENHEFDEEFFEDTAIDWKTIQFKTDSVKLLDIIENSDRFNKKRKFETISHLNLYYLVNEYPQYFIPNYYNETFNDDEIRIITTIEDLLGSMQFFNFVI